MSTDRNSDRDIGAEASASQDADLRLDARLRQRLQASSQLVPAPSERMLAALREAAREQVASQAASQGLIAWVASRPRHLWAAMGSVAVAGAAVAGLVILQKSNAGIDRQAASIVARAEMTAAPAPSALPSVGGAVPPFAAEPSETDSQGLQGALGSDEGVAKPRVARSGASAVDAVGDMERKDSAARPADMPKMRAQSLDSKLAGKKEASYDANTFAQAPKGGVAAELEEGAASGASLGAAAGGYGESRDRSMAKADVADDADARPGAPAKAKAPAPTSPPMPAPAAAAAAPSADRALTVEQTKGPTKPIAVDVRGLAKAGRCTEASKAAAARRKSDASYTAAKADEDLAPCAAKRSKAAESKSAPTKK